MNGMIIIGYPGIGKTSITTKKPHIPNVVDFESSLFYIDKERDYYWYRIYCRQAVEMAKQGLIVMLSSHDCVRNELAEYEQDGFNIVTITPSKSLKDAWIDRLYSRYVSDPSDKNSRAFKHAKGYYDKDIESIASDPHFSNILISDINYDLVHTIQELSSIFNSRGYYYH